MPSTVWVVQTAGTGQVKGLTSPEWLGDSQRTRQNRALRRESEKYERSMRDTTIVPAGRPGSATLKFALGNFWRHRSLIRQMTWREVAARYRGSLMGVVWSLLLPILMLGVYTFVFGVVFQSRWGGEAQGGKGEFAVILFAGLIVHGLFAEVFNRAPGLVLGNSNYVKRVIFPLDILVWVALGSALFHAATALAVLLGLFFLLHGFLHWTILFLPLVLAPLLVLMLGMGWFLAALGVYARDIAQVTGVLTMVLLFLAPVLYPVDAVPQPYRTMLLLNPLTVIIEQAREVLIWGRPPDWFALGIYSLVATIAAAIGFWWFQRTRAGFADVM